VLQGAFRFTTDVAMKARRREVSVSYRRLDSQDAALAVYDQVRAAGYAAEVRPLRHGGQLAYSVRIRNLPSRAEAQALAGQLRGR
jgi:hypothetical protein